jgi:hypothetical protein
MLNLIGMRSIGTNIKRVDKRDLSIPPSLHEICADKVYYLI